MNSDKAIIDKTSGLLACGSVVVAAIAGASLTTVEAVFAMNGSDGVSTDAADIALALSAFGMGLMLGYFADYGAEPPLWWCLRFCPDGPLIIAIEDRGEGHWIATHGWRLADVRDSPCAHSLRAQESQQRADARDWPQ
jgi:hypothetical protein